MKDQNWNLTLCRGADCITVAVSQFSLTPTDFQEVGGYWYAHLPTLLCLKSASLFHNWSYTLQRAFGGCGMWNNLSLFIIDIQIKLSFELTISIRYYGRTEQKNIVKCTFKCITFVSIFHIACATMWAVSKCLMLSWKQQGLGQVLFSYAAYRRTGPLQPS